MRATLLAFLLVLSGCAPTIRTPDAPYSSLTNRPETVTIDITTSEAELAPFRKAGTASVTGQGFLRQKGGGVVTCAGSTVWLIPDLPPLREGLAAARNGKIVQTNGPKWGNAKRMGQCDAQGNFRFDNLPAANWYVMTEVSWMVGYSRQGGTLGWPVTTTEGQTTNVLLSENAYILMSW